MDTTWMAINLMAAIQLFISVKLRDPSSIADGLLVLFVFLTSWVALLDSYWSSIRVLVFLSILVFEHSWIDSTYVKRESRRGLPFYRDMIYLKISYLDTMLFNAKNIYLYVFALSLVAVASYVGNKFKTQFEDKDEYDLVRQYLLNDSPLYGNNKPKIWIHTKYEYNARVWKSFQSRSSMDLNQPYIHMTIKTIVDHCGDDFHICLIDDNTFSKLIPSWDVDLTTLAEPFKSRARQIGLTELVYYYGGMVLPNSFLCMKPMREFYLDATTSDKAFVCEGINRTANVVRQGTQGRLAFLPELRIFGANKNDPTVKELAIYLKQRIQVPHFSADWELLGEDGYWCLDKVAAGKMNLVGGEVVGVKTQCKKPILLENLVEEEYLKLSPHCVGIAIPDEEILARTKYQWIAAMDVRDLLEGGSILSKYARAAIVSGNREHLPERVRKAIAI